MVKSIFNFLLSIIRKDMTDEGESNDMTVLLRYLMLSFGGYYLYLTLIFKNSELADASIFPMVMTIVVVLLFCMTYIVSGKWAYVPFLACMVFSSTFFTYILGWQYGFSLLFLIGVPLFYYNANTEIIVKNLCAFFYTIAVLAFTIYCLHYRPMTVIKILPIHLMYSINTVLFMFSLSLISYFYCQKYIQAEHKLYQYNKKLKQMASRDPLTGLMNRRCMTETLNELIIQYNRDGKDLSVAIGDIDHFKLFNDTYGHDCGDYVLKTLSDIFLKFMDGKGEVCRWGGEEFLFVFTTDNADNVFVQLNDLRHMVKHTTLTFQDKNISVTMTFGLEEFSSHTGIEGTIKKADEKLYLGKESGRDKVVY